MFLSLFLLFKIGLSDPSASCPSTSGDFDISIPVSSQADDSGFIYNDCENLASWGTVTFTFTGTSKVIPANLCQNCKMSQLSISKDITGINDYAFVSCTINSITFEPDSKLGSIGNYAFRSLKIDSSNQPLSITFPSKLTTIGQNAFLESQEISVTLPASLTTIGEGAFKYAEINSINGLQQTKLTTIPESAFQRSTYTSSSELTSLYITIPITLTSIGDSAFYGSGLSSITIPEDSKLETIGRNAFRYNRYLTSINLLKTAKLSTIDDYAFCNTPIQSLTLPKDVTKVGDYAFYKYADDYYDNEYENTLDTAINNRKIRFAKQSKTDAVNLIEIGDYAFCKNSLGFYDLSSTSSFYTNYEINSENHLIFPDSLIKIGSHAFDVKDGQIYYLDLPKSMENVQRIGDEPYSNQIVDLPSTIDLKAITYIGDSAFYRSDKIVNEDSSKIKQFGCSYIETIKFPESTITKIGANAFRNQDLMQASSTSLTANEIGKNAFYGCSKFGSNIVIKPSGVTGGKIDNYAFYGSNLKGTVTVEATTISYSKDQYDYPSIGNYAFQNTSITKIILPHMKSIGQHAFEKCTQLNDQKLDLICDTINSYAFKDCTNIILKSIVTDSIGYKAFENCYKLGASITINNGGGISSNAFSNCKSLGSLTFNLDYTSEDNQYVLQSIGAEAFQNSGISGTIQIPYTINQINSNAFAFCSKLNGVIFNKENSNQLTIGSQAFYNANLNNFNLEIPETVISIGTEAFSYTNIKALRIQGTRYNNLNGNNDPSSALPTSIQSNAFDFCTKLESLTFGNGNINYDNYKYKNSPLTTLKLGQNTKIPDDAFYGIATLGTVTIPKTVTTIGARAFGQCTGLKIVFEDNSELSSIGEAAFYGCTSLTLNQLPIGVTEINPYTFYNCVSLKDADIPKHVSTIDDYAFYGCKAYSTDLNSLYDLTRIGKSAFEGSGLNVNGITFLDNLETVDSKAFSGCSNIKGSLKFGRSIESINDYAFRGCNQISGLSFSDYHLPNPPPVPPQLPEPEKELSIGKSAFEGCTAIGGQLILPRNVKLSKSQYAFRDCRSFTGALNIPETVKTISKGIFSGCSGFTSLGLPSTLTEIPEYAFYRCSGFQGQLPLQDVVTVGKYAFYGCSRFSGNLPCDKLTSVGESAFAGCTGLNGFQSLYVKKNDGKGKIENVLDRDAFRGCTGLTGTLNLKDMGVDQLDDYAFANCTGLTGLILPNDMEDIPSHAFFGCTGLTGTLNTQYVRTIGAYAFADCLGLTGLQLGENMDTIEKYAFTGCTGLTGNLEFPDTMRKIGKYAFAGLTGLSGSLHFSNKLQHIGEYAFSGCTGFSEHLSFLVGTTNGLNIEQRAFQGCTGFKDGRLTITIDSQEEKSQTTHYKYGYFLKIGNEAFEDTEFEDVYYIGRFDPDCDFNTGLSNGIHASTNYVNKTFCHKKVKGKGGLSGGAIAGIVIACIVVVAAIVFVVVFFLCIKGKGGSRSEDEVEMNQNP